MAADPTGERADYSRKPLGFGRSQARVQAYVEIWTYAIRDDRSGDIGYLVWPILGFDAPLPRGIIDRLPPELASSRKVSNLIETREGRDWWLKNGDDINVMFDARPKTAALRRLRAYLRRKGSL